MIHTRMTKAVTGTFVLLALWTCSSDSSNGGNNSISDPEVLESKARTKFVPIVDGINDGLARLFAALAGGPADGVVVTPTAGGADAVIAVDFDGDGSREGSIAGGLVGDVSTGAAVTIASVTGNDPTLDVGGSLIATETSPGVILLDNIAGSGETDPSGSGNAASVDVTDGTVTLDAAAGVPTGFVDLAISGEDETLDISVTFASDGVGVFTAHFTGPGVDFTIP